ncbi:glycosyltransferase family 4 protein [Deinococcus sp. A31D244]|uniref:glycosyltransferase family 4 protein n=1 Tax=Deinococcus sp. A31D244 TaxID=3397675 RepID=UPI0039E025C9
MNILMAHNFYSQPGGEDKSYQAEAEGLIKSGHHVIKFEKHTELEVAQSRVLKVAINTIWNSKVFHELEDTIRASKCEIAHFQNTFPIISPAGYYAAKKAGALVIQSLRNYRLTCVNGLLFREGAICHDCLGKVFPIDGIKHGCYRNSRAGSAIVATMIGIHKAAKTYDKYVDGYIAISDYVKEIYIEAGLPEKKIFVKPNLVNEIQVDDDLLKKIEKKYMLFIGRISAEKGIEELVKIWYDNNYGLPLYIIGDGPIKDTLIQRYNCDNIVFLGYRNSTQTAAYIKQATAVIVPSTWEEPFGRVAAEAFSFSVPVIAPRIGGLKDIVVDGRNGVTYDPIHKKGLSIAIGRFLSNSSQWQVMKDLAYEDYLHKYHPTSNTKILEDIYHSVIEVQK